jgi:DIS3-like exonuclease 2
VLGTLIKSLGDGSKVENRTEAILLEWQIKHDDFPPKIETCLPQLPFVIPEEEIKRRRDFRSDCVFTIDPMTAR